MKLLKRGLKYSFDVIQWNNKAGMDFKNRLLPDFNWFHSYYFYTDHSTLLRIGIQYRLLFTSSFYALSQFIFLYVGSRHSSRTWLCHYSSRTVYASRRGSVLTNKAAICFEENKSGNTEYLKHYKCCKSQLLIWRFINRRFEFEINRLVRRRIFMFIGIWKKLLATQKFFNRKMRNTRISIDLPRTQISLFIQAYKADSFAKYRIQCVHSLDTVYDRKLDV